MKQEIVTESSLRMPVYDRMTLLQNHRYSVSRDQRMVALSITSPSSSRLGDLSAFAEE